MLLLKRFTDLLLGRCTDFLLRCCTVWAPSSQHGGCTV